ncbi:TetR/AcrR family transcriptional regulator [Methylobacter sp.]|uniref:TetR/AcrR family transcriptional regulator n=1 Tax=Methylobacter sp. TaxID=2051955 RepID=UPI00248888FE|nr:TetR/AcrR family transcriptional regulator [Methylobacter sp.]MDI1275847.1 TetR/AcrR family transcriptional regulator [Methylobacter sp.]MDI1356589.1 TetR/AcrR family transcriptional regulator [Methylobacter sp.]
MVRYKLGQKEQTRERIITAAARCFKKGGYSGIGVDGLAKEAGVTSGAFYGHFGSKKAAFEAAIVSGLDEVRLAIEGLQQKYGENWWRAFAKFYMNQKRTCDLTESCALQSLTPEVGRSDEAMRTLFETELLKVIEVANGGSSQTIDQKINDKTWTNLALLIGGVTLARAVKDEKLSNEIANAIQNAVISTQNPERTGPQSPD